MTADYAFFFSYARNDLDRLKRPKQKDDPIVQLYNELKEAVRHELAWPNDDVGFMDQREIIPGSDWRNELREALNSAQTFVYLHSPYFFASPWCGKEFAIFRQRVQALSGDVDSSRHRFIPIYWAPTRHLDTTVPEDVLSMQWATHAHGQEYNENGLKAIFHLKSRRGPAIAQVAKQCRLAWEIPKRLPRINIGALPSIPAAFPKQPVASPGLASGKPASIPQAAAVETPRPRRFVIPGVRKARFLFVAASQDEIEKIRDISDLYGEHGSDWIPYVSPEPTTVGLIAQDAAQRVQLEREVVEFVKDIAHLRRSIEDAQESNTPLAIIIDPWTLMLDEYWSVIEGTLGSVQSRVVCTLFAWDAEQDTEKKHDELVEQLRNAFLGFEQISFTQFDQSIRTQDRMRAELEIRLTKLRSNILSRLEVRMRKAQIPAPNALPIL